jgi:hypothetical protein
MHPDDLLARVRARPFVPFRLVVSEGGSYEVRHPDMIVVARRHVVVGVPAQDNQNIAETTHLVALIHVVRSSR